MKQKKRTNRSWKKTLADWRASGLSREEFCRQEGIFEYLLRNAEQRFAVKQTAKSICTRSSLDAKSDPGFIEVVASPAPLRMLRIITSFGCVVELPL